MRVLNGGPGIPIDEAVLFPFDESSVPLRYRLQTGLVPAVNPYKPHERVLEQGDPQDPDGLGVHYYGSVIRVGDTLRMWYGGNGDDGGKVGMRMCYAESKDGIHWDKPRLEHLRFQRSKLNNLGWMGPASDLSPLRDNNPATRPDYRYKAVVRERNQAWSGLQGWNQLGIYSRRAHLRRRAFRYLQRVVLGRLVRLVCLLHQRQGGVRRLLDLHCVEV